MRKHTNGISDRLVHGIALPLTLLLVSKLYLDRTISKATLNYAVNDALASVVEEVQYGSCNAVSITEISRGMHPYSLRTDNLTTFLTPYISKVYPAASPEGFMRVVSISRDHSPPGARTVVSPQVTIAAKDPSTGRSFNLVGIRPSYKCLLLIEAGLKLG